MTLTVNVISDVVCPWCYDGTRRLEGARPCPLGRLVCRTRGRFGHGRHTAGSVSA